ncbi:MAG: hypothetical protein NC912_06625 [Candidatus Omnitrophica bacterium]|nr:hypothetical protein [Candidatus Omnitrophota bacterium]
MLRKIKNMWVTIYKLILLLSLVFYPVCLKAQERDPFVSIVDFRQQSLSGERIELANVELKGIIGSSEKAIAILNDELVAKGDNWRGFKIEEIGKDSVTLSDGWKSYKIFLKKEELLLKDTGSQTIEKPKEDEKTEEESFLKPEEPLLP